MYVSTMEMFEYLRGVEYPTAKERIVATAKDNGASRDVVKALDELPNSNYFSLIDVVEEVYQMGKTATDSSILV